MPQPKFTYAPLGNSMAARSAICSRVSRALGISLPFSLDDTVDEYGRRNNAFRIEASGRDDLFDLDNRGFCGGGHNRVEVPRRLTINQVSHVVGTMRANERIIGAERLFQDVTLPSNHSLLFAAADFGSHSNRREESWDSCAERAHAFAKNSLRHELKLNFSRVKLLLKIFRARPGKRRDNSANLPILKQESEFPFARAAIIAYDTQISRALPRETLNQIVGKACAAESAEHNRRAIGYVRNCSIYCGIDL